MTTNADFFRASFLKILASDGLILNFFWWGDTEGEQKFHWGPPPWNRPYSDRERWADIDET